MPKAETKSVFRYLSYDVDAEEEEQYLAEMGKKGYILYGFTCNVLYKFRRIQPCNLIYRMDVRDRRDNDYLRLVRDAGWKLAAVRRGRGGVYYYFYKTVGDDSVVEIFTDTISKKDLYRRMEKRAAFSIKTIAALSALNIILLYIFKDGPDIYHFIAGVVTGILAVLFVLAVIAYRRAGKQIKRIRDREL